MSLNQFMHPRNVYRCKPDYKQMATAFPKFGHFLKSDAKGKVRLDYDDPSALRCLTETLLKKDFGLDVDIPENRLIPTVPMRLNYVLWLEDLLNLLQRTNPPLVSDQIFGVDIGTGACCIFPLIGCVVNKTWNLIATDVDHLNLEFARKNVERNDLSSRIKVISAIRNDEQDSKVIVEEVFNSANQIHFLMCNPPFFSDGHDSFDDPDKMDTTANANKQRLESFHLKKSPANTSASIEATCDGGEVEFIERIILESLTLRNKICIYTTMLGKLKSFMIFKSTLERHQSNGLITSFATTEFCQGKTKRWGIAWTTLNGVNLKEVTHMKSLKPKPPLEYAIPPKMEGTCYNLQAVAEKIKQLLLELQVDCFDVVRESKSSIEIWVKSNRNTWTGQRKKRRQAKFANIKEGEKVEQMMIDEPNDGGNLANCPVKRNLNSDEDDEQDDQQETGLKKRIKESVFISKLETYLLHCSIIIKLVKNTLFLKMQSKELSHNRETTFQLFQYFRNKLI